MVKNTVTLTSTTAQLNVQENPTLYCFFFFENLNFSRFVYIFQNLKPAETESFRVDTLKRMNKIDGVLFVDYYS